MTTFHKDPAAVLDYVWDWSAWLAPGDTIASATAIATDTVGGITIATVTHTADKVILWLSGGTVNVTVNVTVQVVTVGGRTDERTARISIVER